MIRVSTTAAALLAAIEAHRPGWVARAEARTEALAAGAVDPEFPSLWSETKDVYMKLQHLKCAYCEKELEDQPIEHDVEHYRPKREIVRWVVPRALARQGIVVKQPKHGSEPGYRLLAYSPFNYAASCKTCNSILKRNYFPIAGTRNATARDPAAMAGERPFLLYPIGDTDDDPEDMIEFAGLSPQVKGTGFRRQRALVTIWLFDLNGKWRQKDRAMEIMRYFLALERMGRSPRQDRPIFRKDRPVHDFAAPSTRQLPAVVPAPLRLGSGRRGTGFPRVYAAGKELLALKDRCFVRDEAQAIGYTLEQVRNWQPPAMPARGGKR